MNKLKIETTGTFNEILTLMKKYATPTTENDLNYLYLIMDTYKLVYEVDAHILRKLYRQRVNSVLCNKPSIPTHKVLARTNLEEKTHELVTLECSHTELSAIHLEIKHKYEE